MRLGDPFLVTLSAVLVGWGCSSGKGPGSTAVDALEVAGGSGAGGTAGTGGTPDAPVADGKTPEGVKDAAPADRAAPTGDDGGLELTPDAPALPPLARTWTARTSPVTVSFESLAAGDSAIVAVGHGEVIVSNDGVSWRKPRSAVVASEVAFGAGTFVAASATGDVAWSTDGDTWTTIALPARAKDPGVGYGGGTFALVAHGYSGSWYASPDGRNWTLRPVEPAEIRSQWQLIFTVFGQGPYLFASKATPLAGGNYVTVNGGSWSVVPEWRGNTYDLTFDGSIYCASGSLGFTHRSSDGKSWTSSRTVSESLLTVTNLEGRFYLAGTFGTVLASRDCITWEEGASPRMPLQLPSGEQLAFDGIRAFKGRLVLVGTRGSIFTSP